MDNYLTIIIKDYESKNVEIKKYDRVRDLRKKEKGYGIYPNSFAYSWIKKIWQKYEYLGFYGFTMKLNKNTAISTLAGKPISEKG